MKSTRYNHLTPVTQKLVLPLLFLGLSVASGIVASAEAGIPITSGGNFFEAMLITVIVSAVLAGLLVFGLISWGRRHDAISDNTEH